MSKQMFRLQAIFVTLAAAAAAVLAGVMTTSASTGSNTVTPEEAGYKATGAQFRYVQASVYLRDPIPYDPYGSGWYQHSLQLRSSNEVIVLGAGIWTNHLNALQYQPSFMVYDPATHVAIAWLGSPGVTATWCDNRGCSGATQGSGNFPNGEIISGSLFYSRSTGDVKFKLSDTHGRVLRGSYFAGLGESFKSARIGTEFTVEGPFSSPNSWIQPPSSMRIASFSNVALTTYSGHRTGLYAWWTHSKLLARMTFSPQLWMASPGGLRASGSAFRVKLTGAG